MCVCVCVCFCCCCCQSNGPIHNMKHYMFGVERVYQNTMVSLFHSPSPADPQPVQLRFSHTTVMHLSLVSAGTQEGACWFLHPPEIQPFWSVLLPVLISILQCLTSRLKICYHVLLPPNINPLMQDSVFMLKFWTFCNYNWLHSYTTLVDYFFFAHHEELFKNTLPHIF